MNRSPIMRALFATHGDSETALGWWHSGGSDFSKQTLKRIHFWKSLCEEHLAACSDYEFSECRDRLSLNDIFETQKKENTIIRHTWSLESAQPKPHFRLLNH